MKLLSLIFTVLLISGCSIQNRVQQPEYRDVEAWNRIEQYFTPPAEYVDSFGEYKNLLIDRDGCEITTPERWLQQRDSIRAQWMSVMGEWPEVIVENPMKRVDSVKCDGFVRYTVELQWLPDRCTRGYLMVPDGADNSPAVITVFYEPETAVGIAGKPLRDFALQLTRRGFVTLSLGTSETTHDKTYSLYYPSIDSVSMQPLNTLAYAAANAFESLALEDVVDAERIGIMGHSYGGKWAMFASCLYDKFACAAWGDPGIVFDETKGNYINYWTPWYLGYYPQPWKNAWSSDGYLDARGVYNELKENHDIHELHALMSPRPFFVSGGEADGVSRWKVLNHAVRLNRMLGYENRVGMSNRVGHDPTVEANEAVYDFFLSFL